MKTRSRIFRLMHSSVPVIVFLLWTTQLSVLSGWAQTRAGKEFDPSHRLAQMMLPGTQDLELIVELSDPALLQAMGGKTLLARTAMAVNESGRKRRIDFDTAEASAYRRQILRSQEQVQAQLLGLQGTQVIRNTSTLVNTISIRTPASNYDAVRGLPGVQKVYFSRPRKALLDSAATMQNARSLWTAVGGDKNAGKGIKIGIIDSGIDLKNKMFSGADLTPPAGFPKYNKNNLASTNSKVIVARSYVTDSAIDDFGHGSFVAGCAAGEPVEAPLASISGMAPAAYLGNYDVLDWRGSTTTSAVMSAIDDAVADGMDVLNLSIGSVDFLPPEENAEYQVLEKAVQSGVVVVVAAGNSGPGTYMISSPATMPDVIAVGSATSLREFLPVIRTSIPGLSTIGYVSSLQGTLVTTDIPNTKIVDAASLDQDGFGCSRYPSLSLTGSIVLIQRGNCTPATKVYNAQGAGARGVIIYNDSMVGMTQMTGLENRASLYTWAVMISMADGRALKKYIAENPSTAQVALDKFSTLQSVPTASRIISGFSSAGPSTDFGIKPDLVAVGENVYSATTTEPYFDTMYDKSGFTSSQGTSFAAPMVTGAAAALLAKFPDLTAAEIKSLLTSTASRDVTVDGTNPAGVLKAGSGLLNMGDAASAGAVFSPTSLSFGAHSYSESYTGSKTLTIKNISSSPDQFTIGFEPIVAGPAITFSKSSTGTLAPKASTDVTITIEATAPATGGFQGYITVRSSSNSSVYRIPYWAGLYVLDTSRVIQVTSNASGTGSFRNLADAVAGAQPGNTIEIAENGSFPTGETTLIINTNREGLPLSGLTIRAAAGRSPVVKVSDGMVGFMVLGVENVRLQELNIQGGAAGVRLYQPSRTVPASVTIDGCTIADTSDIAVFVDGGGSLDMTRSVVENSSGTGLVAGVYDTGTQITITGSTFRGNLSDAMDILDSNVHISNSTISGNTGDGILLYYCTGTVAGNTISKNRSSGQNYPGNGLDIRNGNITVRGNLIDSNEARGITRQSSVSGAVARFIGNTIQGNRSYGLYSAGPSSTLSDSLLVDSNTIKSNGGGVYLANASNGLLLNNLVLRSTDSTVGNGITISSGNNVRLINNTIYRNALNGVNLTGGTVAIANSIIRSNTVAELQGVPAASVQNSITAGDPGFVNADADNFSLAPGSVAIDAGANEVPDLPFLDFSGRLRVASAAGQPGRGTVDIGALEANSAYPLVYPLVVSGTESTLGGSFMTGIAYSNPESGPMQLHFDAFDAEGKTLAGSVGADDTLAAGAQKAILGFQMFGYDMNTGFLGSTLGYADKQPAGFFLLLDFNFRQFSTGANAASRLEKDLVFLRHQSDANRRTSYAIFNPGVNTANITAKLYDSDGNAVGTPTTAAIPAKGRRILQFGSGAGSGYVRVASDRPVSGIELVGNESIMAALGGASPDSQSRLYFSHFAVGGNYSTQVGIVNTINAPAVVALRAYDDNANLLGTLTSIPLKAGGQLMKTLTELFGIPVDGPLKTGYLVAESDQPGIMGYTDYSYSDAGRITSDATIPADSVPSRHLLFSHIAHGVNAGNGIPYQTGIALLNPFGTAVHFTMRVFNGSGQLVAQSDQTIGPRQKVAKILTYRDPGVGFFTPDFVLGNGHVEVISDHGLIGLELFFTEDLSQMASVPAQVVD